MSTYAYSYLRMSTVEQIKGDSLRRQLERTRKYAKEHGLVLDESLQDLGVSAFRGKNKEKGALSRFLAMVQSGQIERGSRLIVENLDRLSREPVRKAIRPFLDIIDAGVFVVTLIDGQEYDADRLDREPWALMGSMMVMIRANEESQAKSDRVGSSWRNKKKNASGDDIITTSGPNWCRPVDSPGGKRRWEVIPEKGDQVRAIFRMVAEGMGMFSVSRATGWNKTSISRMVRSDMVMGFYQPTRTPLGGGDRIPDGDPVPGYYPAVVDRDLVERARAAMDTRRNRGARGRKGKYYSNVFPGLLKCRCGRPMRYKVKGVGGKLACASAVEAHPCQHSVMNSRGVTWVDYDRFERVFLDHVNEVRDALAAGTGNAQVGAAEVEVGRLRNELAEREATLATWTAKLEEPGVSADHPLWKRAMAMGDEVAVLRKSVERAETELARTRQETGDDPADNTQRIRAQLAKLAGPDLYRARARLALEIARFTARVTFVRGRAVIELANGFKTYVVTDGRVQSVARHGVRIVPVKMRAAPHK